MTAIVNLDECEHDRYARVLTAYNSVVKRGTGLVRVYNPNNNRSYGFRFAFRDRRVYVYKPTDEVATAYPLLERYSLRIKYD